MKRIGLVLVFLFQFNIASNGQYGLIYNKISVNPILGFGRNIRQTARIISGNDLMFVTNKSAVFNSLTNSNNESSFRAKMTNKIGLELNYAHNKNHSFGLNIFRHLNVYHQDSPLNWVNAKNERESWYDIIINKSIGLHARKSWWTYQNYKFIQGGISYTNSVKNGIKASGGDGNFAPDGTGVRISSLSSYKNPLFLSGSLGFSRTNGFLIPFRHEFSIGANLPLRYLYKSSFEYFQNNVSIGQNEIKSTQRTAWLTLSVPIGIIKSKLPLQRNYPEPAPTKPTPFPEDEIKFEGNKIKKGENIVLKNINFEQGSDILKFEGKIELNKLVGLMKTYDNIYIQINGHTSDEGDRTANINLSKKRAEACKDYLRSEGIKSKRIETNGYGPDYPISSSNKNLNRRVEFKILN